MDRQIPERQIQFTADTVLIVDDSELNRAILKEIFKESYEIMEAENGRECPRRPGRSCAHSDGSHKYLRKGRSGA